MKTVARIALAAAMLFAGISHLTFARRDFQAQVPEVLTQEFGLDADDVVIVSGVVEVAFGAALLALPRERSRIGALLAAFFVAVFPGNISQFLEQKDGFGLDTDTKRAVRLAFQPLLVAWALWATNQGDDETESSQKSS